MQRNPHFTVVRYLCKLWNKKKNLRIRCRGIVVADRLGYKVTNNANQTGKIVTLKELILLQNKNGIIWGSLTGLSSRF